MMNLTKSLLTLAICLASFLSHAEVSVIVNNANNDSLDAKKIKRIYLGKIKVFADGSKINVISLSDDVPTTEQFRQTALKKSNSQFKSYWSKLAFTGKGTPPKEIANDAAMIEAVKSDPNAIGFVDSASVTGDVKVIATY